MNVYCLHDLRRVPGLCQGSRRLGSEKKASLLLVRLMETAKSCVDGL